MKMTCRGATEASSSRPNRQHPTTSTRRHKAMSNVEAEVEDVVVTHDSNVEVDIEPTEPSLVGPIDLSLLTSFKTHIATAIWNNQECITPQLTDSRNFGLRRDSHLNYRI
ncbi:unnamed protein product [Prunus armeniaca]